MIDLNPNSYWSSVIEVIKSFPCKIRVKWSKDSQPTEWKNGIIIPVESYVETGNLGPVPMREVEWVDIDPIEIRYIGRLVGTKSVDRRTDLIRALEQKGIAFDRGEEFLRFIPCNNLHSH